MKLLTQPGTGLTFKMGRNRPIARGPRLSLKNYLTAGLPAPPASGDYTAAAMASLNLMYDNDVLGDCVIAGMEHAEGVMTGNSGAAPILFTDSQTIALYGAIGGYVPGNPNTDQGCDEQTALNYWQQTGLAGHKIAGWLAVDPVNATTALWLFENLIFGIELPDAWVNPMPVASGFTWDVAGSPDPDNGHCFVACGWSPGKKRISTWAMLGDITDAAIERYASSAQQGELYTVISQDAINAATAKAPNGLDWVQLTADFAAMGARLPQAA